ncbi:MAG: repeat-like domain, partial [Actinomycetota bacterium]
APLYAQFGTVSGSTITWESPVIVSANDTRAASLQPGLPGLAVAEENQIYIYAIGTDLDWSPTLTVFFQFVSNDNGATWSRQETSYVREDNLSYNYFQILDLTGPAHAIAATGYRQEQTAPNYYESISYQDIRVFDGSGWSSLYNHQGRDANAGVINNGQGIATGFYTRDGLAHTAVWQNVSSPVIETNGLSTHTIEDPVLETDGKNRIAFSYAEQLPNNEIAFHLRISTDFGVTWSDNPVVTLAAGNWVCPGFTLLGADTEIIFGYGVYGEEGCSLNVVISNDSGQTWTDPVEVIEGDVSDFWSAEPHWVAGSDATVILTHVVNLENYYYVPTALRFSTAATGPEKRSFKASFKFGELKLSTVKKAALNSWADQIPDGTTVQVKAPDFEQPNAKEKRQRSIQRAKVVAKILRATGVNVRWVPGKVVKWVDPAKGRLVKVRIINAIG